MTAVFLMTMIGLIIKLDQDGLYCYFILFFRLKIAVMAYCNEDFYGPDCATNCTPSMSPQRQQYTCHPETGEVVCNPGKWVSYVEP